jgi:hypothetical protein
LRYGALLMQVQYKEVDENGETVSLTPHL